MHCTAGKMVLRKMGSIRIAVITVVFFACASVATATARTAGSKSVITKKSPDVTKAKPPKWLEICNQLAPATSVLCSLAPLPTIFEASRTKTVGSMPLLPYSSMAANGFVWALYGWLSDSAPVKYANIVGTILGSYYFREFKKYSPPGSSNLPGTMNQHLIGVALIVFANGFILSNFPKKTAAEIVGKEGILIFVILFASPLAAVKNVIATKSAASIPLPFTVASTINCSIWLAVGLFLMEDLNIWLPSGLGLLCALAQLFLKGVYGGSNVTTQAVIQEMSNMPLHSV